MNVLQYQKERKKDKESKSFIVVVDDSFLETDYVSFQKNELVISDNEHEYLKISSKPAICLEN